MSARVRYPVHGSKAGVKSGDTRPISSSVMPEVVSPCLIPSKEFDHWDKILGRWGLSWAPRNKCSCVHAKAAKRSQSVSVTASTIEKPGRSEFLCGCDRRSRLLQGLGGQGLGSRDSQPIGYQPLNWSTSLLLLLRHNQALDSKRPTRSIVEGRNSLAREG